MGESKLVWYEIVVEDEEALSGRSVNRFVKYICDALKIRGVVVSDIVGAVVDLRDRQQLSTEDFLQAVGKAVQFDWAFFFLFSHELSQGFNLLDEVSAIQNADATVRLVDDQFFYVYTDNSTLVDTLEKKYENAVIRRIDISKVSVPY